MNRSVSKPSLTPYLLAQITQFAAGGMMAVIFPWLLTHELHESQMNVGFGQLLANLPFFLLVLVAGVVADGRDLRRYLPRILIFMSLFPLIFAIIISAHWLNFYSLCAIMFSFAVVGSFATPARDALLSHVTPHSLGLARASAVAVAATFGGQVLGTLVAASTATIGPPLLLTCQSVLLVISAMITSRLHIVTPFTLKELPAKRLQQTWHELTDGIHVVSKHERLRTIIIYLFIGAPVFNGMFLVGVPLLVRDVFHGSSASLSMLVTAFLLGLTVSSFLFSRLSPVENPGKVLMLLSLNNILVFSLARIFPDQTVFACLMLAWGLSSGISMALTRGMIQIAAPHAYRARIMAMLQFAQMAGAPLGAALFGILAQNFGILDAIIVVPISVALIWIAFRFQTNLWHFKKEDALSESAPSHE